MSSVLRLQVVLQTLDKATAPIRKLTQTTGSLRKAQGESQSELKLFSEWLPCERVPRMHSEVSSRPRLYVRNGFVV